MINKPVQSKNIPFEDNAVLCSFCEDIESKMSQGTIIGGSFHNGWELVEEQSSQIQGLYDSSNLDTFLDKILFNEIKNTFWCSNCASLAFTRIYCSIVEDSKLNLGFSVLLNENTIDNISFTLLKDFTINFASGSTNVGVFSIYADEIKEYDIIRTSFNEANIVDRDSSHTFATIKFDLVEKKFIVDFNEKNNVKVDSTISYLVSLDIGQSAFLTTSNVRDYDLISAKINFTNGEFDNFNGCYIKSFNNK